MIDLKTILVPTDFSEPSEKALDYARALAGLLGGSLHVLHVVEVPFVHGWAVEGYVAALPDFREELLRRAREEMEKLFAADERKTLRVELVGRAGNPFTEIIRYAKEKQIDLIVMGTHGHGRMAQLLLGSVAEKVVRAAPCPVLTVRHPEHDFVLP